VFVDGNMLSKNMMDHNIRVTNMNAYTIKRIDMDYFDE
jgi:restriction endonuclease Mrr